MATNEVRKAIKSFEQRLAGECKNNPKAFWKYVKSKTVSKDNIIGKLFYNETNAAKAELLNLFFSNVYTDEDLSNIPNVQNSLNVHNIM